MRVGVVGGGVAGLTAAYRLRTELGPDAEISLFESTGRLGGKLRTTELGGLPADVGAEAFLVRRPEAAELAAELGLEVVHPTPARPVLRAGGRTVALPTGTFMGIPAQTDPAAARAAMAEVLTDAGLQAAVAEHGNGPLRLERGEVSLGGLLRGRFGDEVVDRLVDPLLYGVYGASSDWLGLRAVMPALADALAAGAGSVTEAAASLVPASRNAPVFGTFPGGLRTLVDALQKAADAEILVDEPVRGIERRAGGWTVAGRDLDGVVLAVPAPAARRLLAGVSAAASTAFAEIRLSSMAVVTFLLPDDAGLPEASGVLIAEGEHRGDGSPYAAKAFTFSSRKWQHHGDRGVLLRASVGRFPDTGWSRATDDDLVRRVRDDLADLTGVRAVPSAATVRRWGGGLPVYDTRHLDRVARIEQAVAGLPGLEVAGAVLHGVGIPACIGTGDAAARALAARLREAAPARNERHFPARRW